ncbi:MAG: hypothetical protein ACYTXC_12335 [Nostoc sp.]
MLRVVCRSLNPLIYDKINQKMVKKMLEKTSSQSAEKKQSIDDRIVSLTQPHIRPIVRGKAGKAVEFG